MIDDETSKNEDDRTIPLYYLYLNDVEFVVLKIEILLIKM